MKYERGREKGDSPRKNSSAFAEASAVATLWRDETARQAERKVYEPQAKELNHGAPDHSPAEWKMRSGRQSFFPTISSRLAT
jgi:hypothetical protein